MAIKEWSTNYPGSQDTGADGEDQQPTLVNGSDDTRVSQVHTLRRKVQDLALAVGDVGNLPAGSLRDKVADLELIPTPRSLVYSDDVEQSTASATYVAVKTFRFVKDSGAIPTAWKVYLTAWGTGADVLGADEISVQVAMGSDVASAENVTIPLGGESDPAAFMTFTITNSGTDANDTLLTGEIRLKVPGGGGSDLGRCKFTHILAVYG